MSDRAKVKRGSSMTPDQVRKIVMEVLDARKTELDELVARAAKSAVTETLTQLGVDTSNPIEAQATFAALRGLVKTFADHDFQADLAHLKSWRRTVGGLRQHGLTIILSALLTGVIAWMATGFRVSITR
jgi:hypothetical protein